jgi:uncharacterized protein
MQGLAFEWDPKKELANQRKHDVGFADASTVFGDPLSITIPDPDPIEGEERFITLGMSRKRKLLVVGSYYERSADPLDQRPHRDKA